MKIRKQEIDIEFLLKYRKQITNDDKINFLYDEVKFETVFEYMYFETLLFRGNKDKKMKLLDFKPHSIDDKHLRRLVKYRRHNTKSKFNIFISKDQMNNELKEYTEDTYKRHFKLKQLDDINLSILATDVITFFQTINIDVDVGIPIIELIDNVISHSKKSDEIVLSIIFFKEPNVVEFVIFNHGTKSSTIVNNIKSIPKNELDEFIELNKRYELNSNNLYHAIAFNKNISSRSKRKNKHDSGIGLYKFLKSLDKMNKSDKINDMLGYTISGNSFLFLNPEILNEENIDNKFLINKKYFKTLNIPLDGTAYFYQIKVK